MLSLHSLKKLKASAVVAAGFLFSVVSGGLHASVLQDIGFAELPGDRFEIRLDFDALPAEPAGYTIEQPARIVLDFPGVDNALPEKKYPLSFENARSAVILSSGGRTRLVLNLLELDPYVTRVDGSSLVVEVGSSVASSSGTVAKRSLVSTPSRAVTDGSAEIDNVDFRRGEDGEGKILIGLTNPTVDVDVEKRGDNIIVSFSDVNLPEKLRRNLDVVDFATPVNMIRADQDGSKAVFEIKSHGEHDYLAYQADNQYVVSIKPMTDEEIQERKSKFAYVGEKLSLNFQNIEVRSVLQLIADFTELNLVASDTVTGSITLRLDNVPWDQALDLVLKTKGLDKRQIGNVLMVAPAAEIAERERQEIETKKQLEELAPLQTEYIRVRYANARELFDLFSVKEDEDDEDGNATQSILSERGSAIVDERTNSIILTDTAEKIMEFRNLVDQIDIPVRQVMIEARIVIATTDFKKELGVRVSGDYYTETRGGKQEVSGSFAGITNGTDGADGPEVLFRDGDGDGISDDERDIDASNLVDLGVSDAFGSIAWNIITDNVLLGIELSALQENGLGEIVSQPKVITGDKQEAHIQSGTEIPYLEASASGAASTAFKEAVLELRVTPQITPDDHIIMDVSINKDTVSAVTVGNIPAIDVTELDTQVLVGDGQTVVLGGIFETEIIEGEQKVPFLGDLPYVGRLFRKDIKDEEKSELLIFITPKILSDGLIK
jgi:type IV pilus assembly protein PilQ